MFLMYTMHVYASNITLCYTHASSCMVRIVYLPVCNMLCGRSNKLLGQYRNPLKMHVSKRNCLEHKNHSRLNNQHDWEDLCRTKQQ